MKDTRWIDRLVLAAGALVSALTLQDYLAQWVDTGGFLGHYSPKLAVILALVLVSGLLALAGLAISFTPLASGVSARLEQFSARLNRLATTSRTTWLLPLLGGLLWLVLPVLFLIDPWNLLLFTSLNARLWAVWLISLAQVLLWHGWRRSWQPFAILSGSLLVCGLLMLLFNYRNDLSNSPFTLAWSEGSRYYNASLWDSRQVYGFALPLPELHPTRYLLQSLAFWLPGASIAFHRAWQVFLWIFCNGLAAWALVWRLKRPIPGMNRPPIGGIEARPLVRGIEARPLVRGIEALLFGGWAFLFFFMGPVYYHLILCAVVVLWGFDRAHFWRSLTVVVVASLWAGLSRINWYPVPGLLAVTLYLLEEPLNRRPLWRYLVQPTVWAGLGLGAALLANAAYIRFSGNPPEVFGSALNSPLLWYRLLPNATFGPGVFLASLMLLPAFVAIAWATLRGLRAGQRRSPAEATKHWHWLRGLGLAAILAVFYGGGLLVSIKVGGGSNLHNLDSLIVFLAVIIGYVFYNRFNPEDQEDGAAFIRRIPPWLVLVNVILPVIAAAALLNLTPPPTPKMSETQALQWLQGMIDRYSQDPRPVLMITERQLLSFNQLKVKAFEPSYEKVFLMEMAMSGNPEYLGRYFDDIKQRKFSLIITEPMNFHIQTEEQFSEENNFWVRRIEEPTAGRYELVGKLDDYPIAVYAPIPVQK